MIGGALLIIAAALAYVAHGAYLALLAKADELTAREQQILLHAGIIAVRDSDEAD